MAPSQFKAILMALIASQSAALTPTFTFEVIGNATSNFAGSSRDGGGGGKIDGNNYIQFSDNTYDTSGGHFANFSSNSLAASGLNGQGGPTKLTDYGTSAKGPYQQWPYFYNNGEGDFKTGIWPNNNIVANGISFPIVVNRTNGGGLLYSTAGKYSIDSTTGVPSVTRPVQSLFLPGEPLYGTFGAWDDPDGYIYSFASISGSGAANGLKMARFEPADYYERSKYSFWNGHAWSSTMPPYNDGGASNFLNWSETFETSNYGPGQGDLFYSNFLGVYFLIFQNGDPAIDTEIRYSYATNLTSTWSSPARMFAVPQGNDGYTYSFHAYPNYDPTQKVVVTSWTEQTTGGDVTVFGNITFS